MLVRVQPGTGPGAHGLSGAEERVHTLFEGWAAGQYRMPGLVLFNVNVPERDTTRQVDGLLWLPSGLVVLEVKGLTRRQSGTLTIPPNGPWRIGDEDAAIHTLEGTANPAEQLKAGIYAAKNALADITGGGNTFVAGLVILTTTGGSITLDDTRHAGRGIDVALATPRHIRRVLHQHNQRRTCWSVDGVLTACHTLGLDTLAPTHAELTDEGFPTHVPAPTPPRPKPTAPTAPTNSPTTPRPTTTSTRTAGPTTTSTPSSTTASPTTSPPRRQRATPPVPPPRTAPSPPPTPPTPPPRRAATLPPARQRPPAALRTRAATRVRRRAPWGLLIALALLILLGGGAAVFINEVFHGN